MTLYADTSFLVAVRYRRDTFHGAATEYFVRHYEDDWLWCPWHRAEVFHALRQYTQTPKAKRAMTVPEAKAIINRLENDVRIGYLTHLEADWRDVLRTANEISAVCGFDLPFSSVDLLHVAYAKELAADLFVSFDDDQLALARAIGLKVENPA
jgi:predicted nucleic acid-binding protein